MKLLSETKRLCHLYGIRPTRSKGQNFLISEGIYSKIIEEGELTGSDQVLEVGPGFGFMLLRLADQVKKVLAVELDDRISRALQSELEKRKISNVCLLNQDILDLELPPSNLKGSYKVMANLPYNISSIFLRKFLSSPGRPKLLVLLLQKEVAERIVAEPPQMSLLAVSVQYYTYPCFVKKVTPGNFWPSPRVDSAIVKLRVKPKLPLPQGREESFFKLVKAGFSSKRKMLKNNLVSRSEFSAGEVEEIFSDLGLNPKIRAQELSLDDWLKIYNTKISYAKLK